MSAGVGDVVGETGQPLQGVRRRRPSSRTPRRTSWLTGPPSRASPPATQHEPAGAAEQGKRRSAVVGIFPSRAALLRLAPQRRVDEDADAAARAAGTGATGCRELTPGRGAARHSPRPPQLHHLTGHDPGRDSSHAAGCPCPECPSSDLRGSESDAPTASHPEAGRKYCTFKGVLTASGLHLPKLPCSRRGRQPARAGVGGSFRSGPGLSRRRMGGNDRSRTGGPRSS
jgi:hypothetical protein